MKSLNDLKEEGDRWKERVANELKLNPDDDVHQAAAFILFSTQHLLEKGRKTTARDYEKKLDKVIEQALKLSDTINSLERSYRDCLMFSLRGQHGININNSDQIDFFIQSLAEAAKAVKEVKLKPIADGYYNSFLFYFVDHLLVSPAVQYRFVEYFITKNKEPTKDEAKLFLVNLWNTHYSKRARETAIHIIQLKLSVSADRQGAQKAVDRHLDKIVDERIDFTLDKLIRFCKKTEGNN